MKNRCKAKKCKLPAKSIEILRILYKNEPGLLVQTISSLTRIKQRTAYSNLRKLEKAKLVEHVYPVWKVRKSIGQSPEIARLLENKPLEAHAFSFVMRLVRKPQWWDKRGQWLKRYISKDVKKMKLSKRNNYYQFRQSKYLIQAFNDSIIFMPQEDYLGVDAYDCYIQAVKEFIKYYEDMETNLRFRFFLDDVPQVTLRGQNYNYLRDIIAKKCKKSGKGFEILIEGKRVLWVDFSEPLGVESDNPESIEHYVGYIEDIMKNKPPKLSELTEALVQTAKSVKDANSSLTNFMKAWDYYAENMKEHVDILKEVKGYFRKVINSHKALNKDENQNRPK